MDDISEEAGLDFIGAFTDKFAQREKTQGRLKAERKAGLTPAQRNRAKGPPKKQINFRATLETEALIHALAEHLDKSVTDVMATAVEALANALPEFKRKP
jgi:hypothetical protein